jgi:hypothetical protein
MRQQILKPLQRLLRWFFGAPFEHLPPGFGETVPPDLLAFEAKAEEVQRHPSGSVQPLTSSSSKQSKPHH